MRELSKVIYKATYKGRKADLIYVVYTSKYYVRLYEEGKPRKYIEVTSDQEGKELINSEISDL